MAYLITLIAGVSTLIGYFFIYFNNSSNKVLINSLGFASGVMFLMSIYDLLPSSFYNINGYFYFIPSIIICFIFLIIGIISSMLIDKYLPDNNYSNSKLYRVGLVSMLAIIIHNIPEGIATFLTSTNNIKLGISLAIAIALHNIPEGISISVPIYYSTYNKWKAFLYTFVSGISEFIGALIASIFLTRFNNPLFMGCLYSIIAGIMLHISLCELFPSSINYNKPFNTIFSFFIGCLFMFISILLLQ